MALMPDSHPSPALGEFKDGALASPSRANQEINHAGSIECPSHTTERKLIAKIDLHVVPILCLLYFLAFLDRLGDSRR